MREGESIRSRSGCAEAGAMLLAALAAPAGTSLAVPRTMVVGAHPDDESIGAGSRLERLRQGCFVCVTDGAPQDGLDAATHGLTPPEYAKTRRKELEAALALCGVRPEQIDTLGSPDQQASLNMAPLARRLADLMEQHEVEAVLTHCYDGGHPDHDATAFIVHAAAAMLRRRATAPDIVEWTSFRRSPESVLTCGYLPAPAHDAHVDAEAVIVRLTPEELQHKRDLLACHATQRQTLRTLPMDMECYRPAPHYDFTRAPHEGKLNYEDRPWGMTGERFRKLTALAMAELQLEGPL